MRRFLLVRSEDETGISGTGHIANGVQFEDGRVVLQWRGLVNSITIFDDISDLITIHGHAGKTTPEWIDPE